MPPFPRTYRFPSFFDLGVPGVGGFSLGGLIVSAFTFGHRSISVAKPTPGVGHMLLLSIKNRYSRLAQGAACSVPSVQPACFPSCFHARWRVGPHLLIVRNLVLCCVRGAGSDSRPADVGTGMANRRVETLPYGKFGA